MIITANAPGQHKSCYKLAPWSRAILAVIAAPVITGDVGMQSWHPVAAYAPVMF